jgi:hypothetical protein
MLNTLLLESQPSEASACSLGTAVKIKIMGKPSLLYTGLWFGTYALLIRLPSEKYKIASWKKKGFEDLDDLLVSFIRFVIAEDSSCIFAMYYLLR